MIAKIPGAKRFTILLLNWNIFSEDRSKDYKQLWLDTREPISMGAVYKFANGWWDIHHAYDFAEATIEMYPDQNFAYVTFDLS